MNNTKQGAWLQMYLMASYLYYHMNRSPITDEQYDWLCKQLLRDWDTFEHQHKYLVTKADLEAGTGYAIREYPLMVRAAAMKFLEKKT